jgi:hypothetical protein
MGIYQYTIYGNIPVYHIWEYTSTPYIIGDTEMIELSLLLKTIMHILILN